MAQVLITLKIMPENIEVNLEELKGKIEGEIKDFGGTIVKYEHEPIAFGLEALKVSFASDEDKGSTEDLETKISLINGIESVNVVDMRRAIG